MSGATLFVTTAAVSATLLEPIFLALAKDEELLLVTGERLEHPIAGIDPTNCYVIPMTREPSILKDALALARATRWLRQHKVHTVIYGTPKASLLFSIASFLNRVPHRFFVLHGLRHETLKNPLRSVIAASDWVASGLATETFPVSASLRDVAVQSKIISARKSRVLGYGSVAGIDTDRFDPPTAAERNTSRTNLEIADDVFLIGYIGRLARDKGIATLVQAFAKLSADSRVRLLIAGPLDAADALDQDLIQYVDAHPRIIRLLPTPNPEYILHALDAFVLPTFREGLGLAALEAASCGLPLIVSDATGERDTLIDWETGILVPPGEADLLRIAMERLSANPDLANKLGIAGRDLVLERFGRETTLSQWMTVIDLTRSTTATRRASD